jgi:hemolysin III
VHPNVVRYPHGIIEAVNGERPRTLGQRELLGRVEDAVRPMLRGWSHILAVPAAAAGAILLVLQPGHDATERVALALYGCALVLLFGVSGLYHCGRWSPQVRAVWRRLDHANIFLMIAATYTAVAVTVLDGGARVDILIAVWTASIIGITMVTTPLRIPKAVEVGLYLVTGWMAVVFIPSIASRIDGRALLLLLAGGLMYSLGAASYALQRPRLWPRVFGYHEVFHLLVIAATALFFAFVAMAAGPGIRA